MESIKMPVKGRVDMSASFVLRIGPHIQVRVQSFNTKFARKSKIGAAFAAFAAFVAVTGTNVPNIFNERTLGAAFFVSRILLHVWLL